MSMAKVNKQEKPISILPKKTNTEKADDVKLNDLEDSEDIKKNQIQEKTEQPVKDPDIMQLSKYDNSLYEKLRERTADQKESVYSAYSRGLSILEQYLYPILFKRAETGFDNVIIDPSKAFEFLMSRYIIVYKTDPHKLYVHEDIFDLLNEIVEGSHLKLETLNNKSYRISWK